MLSFPRLLCVVLVFVVNLASGPSQFLGFTNSAPEGLGTQFGNNFSERLRSTLNIGTPHLALHHPPPTRPFVLAKTNVAASLVSA